MNSGAAFIIFQALSGGMWQTQRYDTDGHVSDTFTSGNTHTHSEWSCCGKDSDTDAAGRTLLYTYDDLNRVLTTVQEGTDAGTHPAQSDIKTIYTYDAVGRVIKTTAYLYDTIGNRTQAEEAGVQTAYSANEPKGSGQANILK